MTNKKALEVLDSKSLSLLTPHRSWNDVFGSMKIFHDSGEEIELPLPWLQKANATGGLDGDDYDECLRTLSDPHASSLAPELRQALDRINQEIREWRESSGPADDLPESIAIRLASFIAHDGVSHHLVFNEAADAFRYGTQMSLGVARELVSLSVMDLREKDLGKPARPTFEHDEYARMARYVHRQTGWSLMAQSENRFISTGAPVSALSVNSVIEALLGQCSIYDSVRRQPVLTSNRLINEVRAAMARQRPLVSDDKGPESKTGISLRSPAEILRMFAGEKLSLVPTAITPSELLFQAWVTWCFEHGLPPGDKRTFFKRLKQWGCGRISRGKPGRGPHRTPGYSGVAIRVA